MTTIRSPIVCARPVSRLKAPRISRSRKSSVLNAQPVLPNFPFLRVPQSRLRKKRVRFELKLESVEEETSLILSVEEPVAATNKRLTDSWREDTLLHVAYIKNSEKHDTVTSSTSEVMRPSPPPLSPEFDLQSPVFSQSFAIDAKSSELVIDLFAVTTPPPPLHLPPIIDRRTATPKKNNTNDRRHSLNSADSSVKQRVHLATPLHYSRSRKSSITAGNNNYLGPIVKRIVLTTPTTKDFNSSEKLLRTVNPASTKITREHFQSKKTSESN